MGVTRGAILLAVLVTVAAAPAPSAAQNGTVVVDTALDPTYPTTERNATLTVGVENPDDGSGRYLVESVRVYDDPGRTEQLAEHVGGTYVADGSRTTRNLSVGFDETGREKLYVAIRLRPRGDDSFLVTRTVTADVRGLHPSLSLSGGSVGPGNRTTFDVTVANALDQRISGLELDLAAASASLNDDHHVVSGLDPGETTVVEVDARRAAAGPQTVTANLSYTTANGTRRSVTRQLHTTLDGRQSRLSIGLSADPVGPSDRTAFHVTVANGFSKGVSGLELRVRASNATFTERRRVAPRLAAGNATAFSFPAADVDAGSQTVTATISFTTAGGDRRTLTRELTTAVERVRHPGNVTLTGLQLTRENETLRVRGTTSNLGTTNVSGVIVQVADGPRAGPADSRHRYFVGEISASDYSSFEVRATLDGPTNESATVPLKVSYIVDGARVTRTVAATYEPSPDRDAGSGGGPPVVPLVGALVVVGLVAVGYRRWSNGGD